MGNKLNKYRYILILIIAIYRIICSNHSIGQQKLNLSGTWYFKMDTSDLGIKEKWYKIFPINHETIILPGSMPQRNKGYIPDLHTQWTASIYDSSWYFDPKMAKFREKDSLKFPFFLTPKKYYVGPAWYQKKIYIPRNWINKFIILYLERVHWHSTVWIDTIQVCSENSLSCAHVFTLPQKISQGYHVITIRVDNRILDINPGKDSHSLTDQTQGNWNGIVGKMLLISHPLCYIENLETFPDIKHKLVKINIFLKKYSIEKTSGIIQIRAKTFNTSEKILVKPLKVPFDFFGMDTVLTIRYQLGNRILLWDEFQPSLYHLKVTLKSEYGVDQDSTDFGMRELGIDGTYFTINGRKIFIRGTVENCDFPLTGYPPMDVDSWLRIFRICKSYGLNEMRFHSYCPPEAAFKAADLTGIYLHVEGPSWANHGSSLGDGKPIDKYIYDETNRIDAAYGNHPSFCLMAYGNEPRGSHQVEYLNRFVQYWKKKDSRHLYTGASVGMSWPWIKEEQFIVRSGPRGLPWVNYPPQTLFDYRDALKGHNIPYVAHEMGQYCAFPDFHQIKKYSGVMEPRNFELFRDILNEHHMGDEADKFLMASGKLQVICYKGEIEAALRTPGMAGFELLALNDYTGQGTAPVGILDVFWESKGYVEAKTFNSFCNAIVPLARIPKFTYYNNENFNASLELANFSSSVIRDDTVEWKIMDNKNNVLAKGSYHMLNIPIMNNIHIGNISLPLNKIQEAKQLILHVDLKKSKASNYWSFWVFPKHNINLSQINDIYITHILDSQSINALQNGKKVLLLCAGRVELGKDVSMHFLPVFWNTSWFKMRPPHTTGIYIDATHPLFKNFPTSYFQDFQWWSLVNKQQVMWLKDFPPTFKPIVQPIDTWFRSRKLGLIWEAQVGNGRILACSSDLEDEKDKYPEKEQMLYAIIQYMESSEFKPKYNIGLSQLISLFEKTQNETYNFYSQQKPDELLNNKKTINNNE